MSTINNSGKVGYMYDQPTDTFHALTGVANTAANYTWSGSHSFSSPVTISDVVLMTAGYNNFQNPAARDAAITSPANGVLCFVRQDSSGSTINQLQVYSGGKWIDVATNQSIISKTANYTLGLLDAGRLVSLDSASDKTFTVPPESTANFAIGQSINFLQNAAGKISFAAGAGVTINSYLGYRKTAGTYAKATLQKIATNSWILSGDLSS